MTDLLRVLPHFPATQFATILQALDRHRVSTTELLTADIPELARRTNVSLLDLKRFSAAVLNSLHRDLSVLPSRNPPGPDNDADVPVESPPSTTSFAELRRRWATISTLDDSLDRALGGGIPTGYVTEITGESGAGKTQFLLSLLLAVQLPPPHGLSRPALYISTEAPLSTRRLSQMLSSHPLLASGDGDISTRPSLDNIMSTSTPDLESQEHILQFQVPVEVQRRNVGLIVLDSVAANYRAEFDRGAARRSHGSNMAARSNELVRLGALLRDLAQKHNLAVVVANQVADRFLKSEPTLPAATHGYGTVPPSHESPLASRSRQPVTTPTVEPSSSLPFLITESAPLHSSDPPALLLDHQQRWFTGWGDDPYADYGLKTPSLGLVWSTQIACRIALLRKPVYGPGRETEESEDAVVGQPSLKGWRRWMKVVFAPHVAASGQGLRGATEFEITMAGLKGVPAESDGGRDD